MSRRYFYFIAGAFALLLVALVAPMSAAGSGEEPTPKDESQRLDLATAPRVASYVIKARLDDKTHTVEGSAKIRFENPSHKPTDHLFFHLYLNAFEGKETLFLRKRASRSGQRQGALGKIEVHSLTSPDFGSQDLWPREAHSPGDEKDRTDIKVPLPRRLQGREVIDLELTFTSHLPELVERTGFERDFFLVAQWFPKLAKREPDGRWAHFPFHPNGEFYADFGDYHVTLDVPTGYVVGSTGQLRRLGEAEEKFVRYEARAQGVHDFAWTAWPGFLEETRDLRGVKVTLLRPKHTPRIAQTTWQTLDQGLLYLGEKYGRYPHPTLTVVIPPDWAARAGGMEYPTFITTGGTEALSFFGIRDVELLTIHELGHQWFQGMLASNEMESPFLDEGLTSYAESRYLEEKLGAGSLADWPWLKVSRLAGSRYGALHYKGKLAIASSAPEFDSFQTIGSLVYARSALALETLARVYGQEKLDQALRLYSDRYRFRHPRPRDFFNILGEVLGKDARKQAVLMFEKQGSIDLSVPALETRREDGRFRSQVSVWRSGNLELPVSLAVRLADETERTFSFPKGAREHTFDFEHDAPLLYAEIDPKLTIPLDDNLENNRRAPEGRAPDRDQQLQSAWALFSWMLGVMTP